MDDPDLLLAIALSQSLMKEQEGQEKPEPEQRPDTTITERTQESQKSFWDELSELLQSDSTLTSVHPLYTPLIDVLQKMDCTFEQIYEVLPFLEVISAVVVAAFKKNAEKPTQTSSTEKLCDVIQRFCFHAFGQIQSEEHSERAMCIRVSILNVLHNLLNLSERTSSRLQYAREQLQQRSRTSLWSVTSYNTLTTTSNEMSLGIPAKLWDLLQPDAVHEKSHGHPSFLFEHNLHIFASLQGVSTILIDVSFILRSVSSLEKPQVLDYLTDAFAALSSSNIKPLLRTDWRASVWCVDVLLRLLQLQSKSKEGLADDQGPGESGATSAQIHVDRKILESMLSLLELATSGPQDGLVVNMKTIVIAHLFRMLEAKQGIEVAAGIRMLSSLSEEETSLLQLALELIESLSQLQSGMLTPFNGSPLLSTLNPSPETVYQLPGGSAFRCLDVHSPLSLAQLLLGDTKFLDRLFMLMLSAYFSACESQSIPAETTKDITQAPTTNETSGEGTSTEVEDDFIIGDIADEYAVPSAEQKVEVVKNTNVEPTTKATGENVSISTTTTAPLAFVKSIFRCLLRSFLPLESRDYSDGPFLVYFRHNLSEQHLKTFLFLARQQSPQEQRVVAVPQITDTNFIELFRSFGQHLALKVLPESLEHPFLAMIGLSEKGEWPLALPLETLLLVAWLTLKRSSAQQSGQEDSSLALGIWNGILLSLHLLFQESDQPEVRGPVTSILDLEHCLLLLFLFHTLPPTSRATIFTRCLELLGECGSKATFSAHSLLGVSRLLLLTEHIWLHFDSILPSTTLELLESNVFKRGPTPIKKESRCDVHYFELNPVVSGEGPDYKFTSSAKPLLVNPSKGSYETLYRDLIGLSSKIVQGAEMEHQELNEYFFKICWRFISILPPSSSFLESLRSPTNLCCTDVDTNMVIHQLHWLYILTSHDNLPEFLSAYRPSLVDFLKSSSHR